MKRIYVVFDDDEFKAIKRVKGKLSWHDFIFATVQGLLVVKDMEKGERKA